MASPASYRSALDRAALVKGQARGSQPQAQIATAINAAEAALASEPELADKATLQHAINLLRRVFSKNATEESPAQASPPGVQSGLTRTGP